MMRVLRVRHLTTRARAVPPQPSKHGGRDHLDVSRQEQPASPRKTRSGDASLASSWKLFPVSITGRNVRPRSRASSAGGVASARRADGQLRRRFRGGHIVLQVTGNRVVVYILSLNHAEPPLLYSALEKLPPRRSDSQSTMIMHKRSG